MNNIKSFFVIFLQKLFRFYKDNLLFWLVWISIGFFHVFDGKIGAYGFFFSLVFVFCFSLLFSVISSLISVIYGSRVKMEVSQDE